MRATGDMFRDLEFRREEVEQLLVRWIDFFSTTRSLTLVRRGATGGLNCSSCEPSDRMKIG